MAIAQAVRHPDSAQPRRDLVRPRISRLFRFIPTWTGGKRSQHATSFEPADALIDDDHAHDRSQISCAKKVSVRPDIIGTRFHVKLLRLTSDLPRKYATID
jgi:hypothetical protein